MKRNLLIVIAVIGLIGYTIYDHYATKIDERHAVQAAPEDDIVTGNKKGQLAPGFELLDLNGNLVQLSDYRGKKVLVNFWATWCPPCRAEMPDMQRIHEDYEGEAVVLGVNLTKAEPDVEAVRSFAQDLELTFPVVLDEEGVAINAYRIVVYPTTFALDEKGVIREVYMGAIHYETMKQTIESIE